MMHRKITGHSYSQAHQAPQSQCIVQGLRLKVQGVMVVLSLLLCSNGALAIDLLKSYNYNFVTIPYVSVDAENNPVVLSASISYPTKYIFTKDPAPVSFVVLYNHPTICADYQAPSGDTPLDAGDYVKHGAMRLMTTEDALVISCDYLGYGYSRNRVHPYCNHTLTARNVIDGYIAALDSARAMGVEIADDYYTYSMGYSQGGGVTMAVQRYLETEASEEENSIVRLRKSFCGAGPYDLETTYKDLASRDTLAYPCSIAMTIEGIYAAYKEGCMRQVDLDSIYSSHDFRTKLESMLLSKDTKDEDIDAWIKSYYGKEEVSIRDFIRPEVLDHSSAAAHAMDKALSKCNMLNGAWIPKTPMTLFQYTQDDVVPFSNSQRAAELFGDKVKLITEKDGLQCSDTGLSVLLSTVLMPDPQNHLDYGTMFIVYFLDGVLRDQ